MVPGDRFVQGGYDLVVLMVWPATGHGTNLLCRWPDGWARTVWKETP